MIFKSLVAFVAAVCCSALPVSAAGTKNEVAVEGYNNEPIIAYATDSDFARLGRPVGQLRIETDAGPAPCTAFLVSDTHILTNYHCIPGVLDNAALGATRITGARFALGFVNPGLPEEARVFEVNPTPVESNAALDYSVLEVSGNPAATFGVLRLAPLPIAEGMPFLILGHPLGKSQHISREGCRAARPAMEGDRLRHTCDTLAGNSGSPIIDASSRTVVGLHNSGNSNEGVNFGIPMAMILAQSTVLKAALPEQNVEPPRATLTLYPSALRPGGELAVTADVPQTCVPAFFDIAPSGRITPVPAEIFEVLPLSADTTRYQVTQGSRFGLVVLEEDERGAHRFGYLCPPPALQSAEGLKGLLRLVRAELDQGRIAGSVGSGAEATLYRFETWTVLD